MYISTQISCKSLSFATDINSYIFSVLLIDAVAMSDVKRCMRVISKGVLKVKKNTLYKQVAKFPLTTLHQLIPFYILLIDAVKMLRVKKCWCVCVCVCVWCGCAVFVCLFVFCCFIGGPKFKKMLYDTSQHMCWKSLSFTIKHKPIYKLQVLLGYSGVCVCVCRGAQVCVCLWGAPFSESKNLQKSAI